MPSSVGALAQERRAAVVDGFLVEARLATAECRRARLGGPEVRRDGRRAVEALEPEQVAAFVDDGDGHRPAVGEGFGTGGFAHAAGVGDGEAGACFHGRKGLISGSKSLTLRNVAGQP
jgi:hypothetical protein